MVNTNYSKHPAIIRLNEAGDYRTKESALMYNWIRQNVITHREFRVMIDYIKERERIKFS